jgi:hypothetical protein
LGHSAEELTVIAGLWLLISHERKDRKLHSSRRKGTSIDVHSTAERIVSEAVNEVRGESMTDKVEGQDERTLSF